MLASAPPSLQAQVSLVASELVTNVLRHSTAQRPEATLTLAVNDEHVIVAVADAGMSFNPVVATKATASSVGGWGLMVLDAVADRWWVERNGGTLVVCEIAR